MDFARRQLEKYGWKDGKGLGKNENGISEALRPKLKRSVTGIGHDAASEFNDHWWEKLYDKAATNIQVKEKNGKTKKIKTLDSSNFVITNSMWHLTSKKKMPRQKTEYQDYFIKKSTLTPGVSVCDDSLESDDEEAEVMNKMTDEELFAACGGRTAHKGARHGLKALGKLARIEEQERRLLTQSKYNGYSHAKASSDKESNRSISQGNIVEKVNKRKHMSSGDSVNVNDGVSRKKKKKNDVENKNLETEVEGKEKNSKKKFKSKKMF